MEELLDLETAGWRALVDGSAAAFYRGVVTDDALLVVPGMTMRASTWIASLDGPQWSRFDISDPRVLDLADDCAAVVYHVVASRDGDAPYAARMASIYRRVGERWKLALHQQTPDP